MTESKRKSTKMEPAVSSETTKSIDYSILNSIAKRAHYLATQMIYQANHRVDKEKGDPKIGGHVSASASALHILGALHLIVKTGFDYIANKPHASPTDHAYNYLLDLFLKNDLSRLTQNECDQAMHNLRSYSKNGEYVFQSYHSAYDSDHGGFFPSGTVGIPPVMAGYLALAYRFAKEHGHHVPEAHFWALCGDSEFREGSLHEAIPDFAEREINNLTWILDYNRQSLDGHRITNKSVMEGTDADRVERSMIANGWEVIQLRHGSKRSSLFKRTGGEAFKQFLENEVADYELQALLLVKDMQALKKGIIKEHGHLKDFLNSITDTELYDALRDFGGHDIRALTEAMLKCKKSQHKPTMIIAHTLKGWGLRCAAQPGNHSQLPTEDEMSALKISQNISQDKLFERFKSDSAEGKFLSERGNNLLSDFNALKTLKEKNIKVFQELFANAGELPTSLNINTKMTSYPHTQWMLGQLTAKLTRIANTSKEVNAGSENNKKSLSSDELVWKTPAELFVSMAPDVGTSTNLNPAMDGKIFGVPVVTDLETEFGVKDSKTPDLVPGEDNSDRYLRFEIVEGNVMSCVGSFGKIRDILGIPIIPLMSVYDFFIKRALDQYFYNLYWKSSFICVGTPSGVTLSPEGAQHGWKSDFQIPNQITWEPFFCQELDWILCDTIKRHIFNDNEGRTGTLLRLVTRGAEQKDFLHYLKKQARFKVNPESKLLSRAEFNMKNSSVESEIESIDENKIFATIREEVLMGAYFLIDYKGYAGYEPGDNVVHIFAMGSLVTEAIKSSEALLSKGIFANVIVVTSSDLLCGILAHENDYKYLKSELGINANLYLNIGPQNDSSHAQEHNWNSADAITIAGKRIPIVSVHDGEPGILDNIGSIVGVSQESCAVRKHSKCGRPSEIYHFHNIDSQAIIEACEKVLTSTSLENVSINKALLKEMDVLSKSNEFSLGRN